MSRRRRHPVRNRALLGIGLGALAGYGLDALPLIELDPQGRGIVIAVVAPLVVLLASAGRRLFRIGPGYIYMAVVQHPRSGRRVCGYVGKTIRDPRTRWNEHQFGGGRYGSAAQPWSDTIIEWRVLHSSRRMTALGLHLREWINIKCRLPLYNIQMNRANPRRIPPWTARNQRATRDAIGARL